MTARAGQNVPRKIFSSKDFIEVLPRVKVTISLIFLKKRDVVIRHQRSALRVACVMKPLGIKQRESTYFIRNSVHFRRTYKILCVVII